MLCLPSVHHPLPFDIVRKQRVRLLMLDLMPQFKMGETFVADVPAIDKKNIEFKIYYISPLGSFATWNVNNGRMMQTPK